MKLYAWGICVIGVLCMIGQAQEGPLAPRKTADDGKTVNGLRLILRDSPADKTLQYVTLTLENVSDDDLNVQLGYSLANGKSHHPSAIRLFATSRSGTQTRAYSGRFIAGRVDPLVMPLAAHSSYTFRCEISKFKDVSTGEGFELRGKTYQMVAELVGTSVTKAKQDDMAGLALMPYWQGTVLSNPIAFTYR